MTPRRVSAWLGGLRTSWQGRDPAAVARLFTEDVVYARSPFQPPLVGREAVLAHWVAELTGVVAAEVAMSSPFVEGDRAAVEWRSEVTRVDGRTSEAGVLVLEFEGDLCSRLAEYWMVIDGSGDVPEARGRRQRIRRGSASR